MLYKLTRSENVFGNLEPLSFLDFADLGKLEKDLEVI